MKSQFHSWWDGELLYHNHLLRQAKKQNQGWQTRVAVMIERLPVVTPDMDKWETEFRDLRDWFATYGREYPEETGFMYAMDKPEDHIVPSDEELLAGLPFTLAPRETMADRSGNIHTRDRCLKTSVYLAIQSTHERSMSGRSRWTLPSTIATNHETLLQSAQRVVTEFAGPNLKVWCPGNAPMACNLRVYNRNLPEKFRGNYYGERVFYYRVQYDSGDVEEDTILPSSLKETETKEKGGEKKKGDVDDWGWLSKEEIVTRVEGERGKHQAKFFHYML